MSGYTQDNASAPGIAHPWEVSGSPVVATAPSNSGQEGIARATQYSTAPWKNPRAGKCQGNNNTCRGDAGKSGYCGGHMISLGFSPKRKSKKVLDESE